MDDHHLSFFDFPAYAEPVASARPADGKETAAAGELYSPFVAPACSLSSFR